MRRREFIAVFGGAAAAWPLAARAQQAALPVIGWLDFESPKAARETVPAFMRGLADKGYVEGRNVIVEYRWAEGKYDRLPALAADLISRKAAVIVALTTASALSAKAATQVIPIVFRIGSDPVEIGLVASLSRPGGNITGIANLTAEITAKRLALLHELVPAATSIAVLINPSNITFTNAETKDLQAAARLLGVRALVVNAGTDSDLAEAFATVVEQRAGALLISAETYFLGIRDQIISLAARNGIPTMFFDKASAAAGGLLSYGPDFIAANRQVGLYAGRILGGEKPADLPVVQTTKFELAINLRTAKALGITVPTSMQLLADEVIE
jgi:putative ABC transport system substrate-binding protein